MRVLVTGGAGYIGSGVVEELLASGHRAVVYDNLYKGHRDAVHPAAEFVHADLLDAKALHAAISGADAVVHLAAHSLVGESVQEPAKYYRNNVVAGLALADAMREHGVRWLVFSSTAAVYGESAKQPIEETDPTAPTNPYGETKLAFENALRWYSAAYGLRSISLRYFNAAGATARCRERHEPETHLVPVVLQAAAGRIPEVTIFGADYPTPDGTCVRDYIHVSDLARAHLLALQALADGHAGGSYNLGCGGSGYSVMQVIEVARSVSGRDIRLRIGPRRPGDPAVLVASSQRIMRDLGWRPRLQDLREIVRSAWEPLKP
ncbi:MAG: UDP-glucose 4-epimerase GalE [Deltaproteobacteria bacterium]|nr:MAG: UDP-glucose 4-epimerase GalE [Deltaproteobacteria bacterium]